MGTLVRKLLQYSKPQRGRKASSLLGPLSFLKAFARFVFMLF